MAKDAKRFIGRTLIYEGRDYLGDYARADGTVDFVRPKGATAATHPYSVVTIFPEGDEDFREGSADEAVTAIRAHAADWHKRVTSLGAMAVMEPKVIERHLLAQSKTKKALPLPDLSPEQTKKLDALRTELGSRAMTHGEDAVKHVRKFAMRRAAGGGKLCYLVGAMIRPPIETPKIEVPKPERPDPKVRSAPAQVMAGSLTTSISEGRDNV